jgi:hypothetical protein
MSVGAILKTFARAIRAYLLNLLAAVMGTGVLEATANPLLNTITKHINASPATVRLGQIWLVGILCAGFIGFFVRRRWRTESAKWVWVIPALFVSLRVANLYASATPHSVFVQRPLFSDIHFLRHFSGIDCLYGLHSPGCTDFLLGTMPLMRCLAYSVAAFISGRQILETEENQEPVVIAGF